MIKADELEQSRPTVRVDSAKITLQVIQRAVKDVAQRDGIPVAFRRDEVKSGGFLNSSVEDCLVVYHPEHEKDYYGYCFRLSKQGRFTFISVDFCGKSKQIRSARSLEYRKNQEHGLSLTESLLESVHSSVNKHKLEQEQMYYVCMDAILDELLEF